MAPSPSAETVLDADEAELLLDIADAAVVTGLRGGPPTVRAAALPPALRADVGVFVTLTVDGELNGCIGSIEGVEPLAHGTARHAWSAAFADPRLPPLQRADYPRLTIDVSVLSPLTPMRAATRQDVLTDLERGVHGLVIAVDRHQAAFLPAVWDQLPEPEMFLDHLQAKAGLAPGRWPTGTRAWRFDVQKFTRGDGEASQPIAGRPMS